MCPIAGCGPVLKYMMEKHQELETINIDAAYSSSSYEEDEDEIFLAIFSNIKLKSICITGIKKSSGEVLSGLPSTLPNLEKLKLDTCFQLTDPGLHEILRISGSNLTEINLNKTSITGLLFDKEIKPLHNLEKLSLEGCPNLTNSGLQGILSICGGLKELNLSDAGTGIGFVDGMISLPNLEKLNLHGCSQLTDEGFHVLMAVCGSRIRELDLSHTRISDWGSELDCKKLPNIEMLKLAWCSHLTHRGLGGILKTCGSKLRELDLQRTGITGNGLEEDLDALSNLETLSLRCCTELRMDGLNDILNMSAATLVELDISEISTTGLGFGRGLNFLPNLEKLNLRRQPELEDEGVLEILGTVGNKLKELDISSTNISGIGFHQGLMFFPNLENLTLEHCSKLGDKGLPNILRICGCQLRALYLSGSGITGAGLQKKLKPLPNLEILSLIDCVKLTKRGLKKIMKVYGTTVRTVYVNDANMTRNELEKVQRRFLSVQSMTFRQFDCKIRGNPILL